MRRYNGVEQLDVDDVGEISQVNAKLMRSAFNRFLTQRGLPANSEWNTPFGRPTRRKNEIDRAGSSS